MTGVSTGQSNLLPRGSGRSSNFAHMRRRQEATTMTEGPHGTPNTCLDQACASHAERSAKSAKPATAFYTGVWPHRLPNGVEFCCSCWPGSVLSLPSQPLPPCNTILHMSGSIRPLPTFGLATASPTFTKTWMERSGCSESMHVRSQRSQMPRWHGTRTRPNLLRFSRAA